MFSKKFYENQLVGSRLVSWVPTGERGDFDGRSASLDMCLNITVFKIICVLRIPMSTVLFLRFSFLFIS
jgi:hypothetical protein